MSANNHWMPLFIGDYLSDTGHLTTREHGAYLLLIMHYWRTGPLRDDDEFLAKIAKVDARTWRASVGPAIRPFFQTCGGHLQHKRIDHEIERVANVQEVKRKAAEIRHRKQKEKQNGGGGGGPAYAEHMQSTCNAHAEHMDTEPQPQLESQEEKREIPQRAAAESVPPARVPAHARGGGAAALDQIICAWNEMADRVGLTPILGLPPQRRAAALARIAEHGAEGVLRAIEAVEASEFCLGGGGRGWKADFDWLMGELNICKVIEGKYAEVASRTSEMDRFRRQLKAGIDGNVTVFPGRRLTP